MIGIQITATHHHPKHRDVKGHGVFDRCRSVRSSRVELRELDSFLLCKCPYKSHRENRQVEVRGAPVNRSRTVGLGEDDDENAAAAAPGDEALLKMPDVDRHFHEYTSDKKGDTTNRRSAMARWGIGMMMWVGDQQNSKAVAFAMAKDLTSRDPKRVKYVAQKEGFQFEYPSESFVVAFDRTGGGTKDGALVSVGDFTRYIVVSVFQQQSQGIPASVASKGLDTESGYALCLDPVIQADSTIGFRVIEALMIPFTGNGPDHDDGKYSSNHYNGKQSGFAFEYQVSICRGDTVLEGKGGALRCQVRVMLYFLTLGVANMDL